MNKRIISKHWFIGPLFVLFLGILLFHELGVFNYPTHYKRGTYWHDSGYAIDKIYVWHNGKIIFSDYWRYTLSDNRDSLRKLHEITAKDFIEHYKKLK